MALLSADDLHLSFGPKTIFAGDSLAIEPGDRLGLVGPNGAGKSTLLRILAGEATPDGGRVTRAKGIRVGYLSQEHGSVGDLSLRDSVLTTAPGRDDVEARLAEVEAELVTVEDVERQMVLSEQLADLHERLARLEEDFGPHRAEAILCGLGFSEAQLDAPVSRLSGGWRMRAALAALLYQQPDVLLLDEPTNHLDLPSVRWLSDFLRGVRHAVVLTCHDREFLNRHVERVASLELEGIRTFRGDYDAYLEQRALDLAHLEARIEREAEKRKRMEQFVERFRAKATKARQAQSRAKMIERMEAEQEALPELRRPMRVRFDAVPKCAERVLALEDLRFGYVPGRPVLDDVHVDVARGDRIAIVGVNGAGKTTLLRLIAGELAPEAGRVVYGRGVETSYFAQHHTEALALGRSVVEEVRAANPEASETKIRALCGAVLFSGDDVDKPVEVLSGGERARVALARMLARPANLLLLDEPTNHLDTESADVLTESLDAFEGTILFVSHNLDFARRLSTKVWDVSGGTVEVYPGTLGDYLDRMAQGRDEAGSAARGRAADLETTFAERGLEHARPGSAPPRAKPEASSKAARKAAREEKRRAEAEARKREKKARAAVEAAEAEVARLEGEKAAIEAQLAKPEVHARPEELEAASRRLGEIETALEAAMDAWTEAEAELEA